MPSTLASAAAQLARRGYRVFPVRADKAPLTARGHHDGTTDLDVVERWCWDGGIGLVVPDGVFVLDVDPRNGGKTTLDALLSAGVVFPRTRTVATQSGGRHYYFTLPDDRDIRGKLGPGVDIKKPGRGYVLVPPTPGYSYLRGGRPAPAPQWLLDEITVERAVTNGVSVGSSPRYFPFMGGTGYGLSALAGELERVRTQSEGGRRALLNTVAFSLATLAAGGELDEDRTLESLLEAAVETGLSERQALTAIRSGWYAGLSKPRSA